MANIKIIITDKKTYPHYSFREESMNFELKEGVNIVDAHNVLVDMATEFGRKIIGKSRQQEIDLAERLVTKDIVLPYDNPEFTFQQYHDQKKCSCFLENQYQSGCMYTVWINDEIDLSLRAREIIAKRNDY